MNKIAELIIDFQMLDEEWKILICLGIVILIVLLFSLVFKKIWSLILSGIILIILIGIIYFVKVDIVENNNLKFTQNYIEIINTQQKIEYTEIKSIKIISENELKLIMKNNEDIILNIDSNTLELFTEIIENQIIK